MSKTRQRKRSYKQLGMSDFKEYGIILPPFLYKKHYLNTTYMRGYKEQLINERLKENNSLLNWFRIKFHMM